MDTYRVLGINTDLEIDYYPWFDEYGFYPEISFSDYDAVIIDTGYLLNNYQESSESPYLNKKLLTVNESHRIVEEFHILKEQILDYLKQGKTVFVILGNNENCYICKDKWEYGDKELFDSNSFLPVKMDIKYLTGEKIERCNNYTYKDFFNGIEKMIYYAAQFSIEGAIPLLKVPNSNMMISAELPYENGRIVFLPDTYVDYDDGEDYENHKKIYLDELYKLIDIIYASDDFILPKWTNSFQILDEKKQQEKHNSDLAKLEKLRKKIEKEKGKLESIQRYKALLTETGTALEGIIKQVLSEIGFKLKKPKIGRSDIVAKYKNIFVVAEIKGVTKSSAEKHAAQLEKWVSQFIEENGTQPKALLIVNAFKDTPVFERTEEVFPTQMLKYSTSREHTLISTTQLLCLYIDIKSNPDKKDELITEMLSTVGVYNKYSNIEEYLQPIEKDEN